MNSKRIFLALLACLMLVLGACSGSEDGAAVTPAPLPQYTLPPIEKEAVPIVGGELTFPIPENPGTINPLKIQNVELYNLMTLIYERPIRIDVDGKAISELAETWEPNVDGTVWTFYLRKGVQWQRGYGEFTADDVIYTIDLIKSYSKSECSYARYNDIITTYNKIDNYTVTVTLSEPGNAAVYFMTFPVVCKAYCDTGNIDTLMPVGTGPYLATEYDDREQMLLQANNAWWKQPPYIQHLTAKCYPNYETELAEFKLNLLDFMTTSLLTVDTYRKYGEIEIAEYLTNYYDCLVPNVTEGLFSDVNVRLAIAYALNKRDIISEALLSHAVATDYPIRLDSYLSGGSTNIYEYNLQKAVELLDQSGWKERDNDGIYENVSDASVQDLSFELLIPLNKEDTYRRDVAENIAEQLKSCGMDVDIVEADNETYMRRLGEGNFDIALCSFYLDSNPDATFMLGTDAPSNYGGYANEQMDALLKRCKQALKEDDMVTAYAALEDFFVEQAPQIGLYYRTNALMYKSPINVAERFRDLNIYTTLPQWYLFVENSEETQ